MRWDSKAALIALGSFIIAVSFEQLNDRFLGFAKLYQKMSDAGLTWTLALGLLGVCLFGAFPSLLTCGWKGIVAPLLTIFSFWIFKWFLETADVEPANIEWILPLLYGLFFATWIGALAPLLYRFINPLFESANPVNQRGMHTDSNSRVFVSHSRKDAPFVKKLVEELRKRPLNVWFDQTEIKVGDSFVSRISEGLKETDYVVVVLSKASVSSPWVQEELNASLASQVAGKGVVLPVLIEDCDVPVLLRGRLYADFRYDFNTGLQELLSVFEQEGESVANAAPGVAIEVAPCSQKLSAISMANLRRLITNRMDLGEVNVLWFDVLETNMENDMPGRQLSDCVIALLEKAKSRNKLSFLIEKICKDRPDIAN